MKPRTVIPPFAIEQIANVIATQNPDDSNYMKGEDLVNLFNAFGYPDTYTFFDGRGIQTVDFGEGLSRLAYVTKRLQDLNKTYQVPNAIQEFLNRSRQPLESLNALQNALKPLSITQFLPNIMSVAEPSKGADCEIEGYSKIDVNGIKSVEIEHESKLNNERRKALIESVLGKIPDGHPVVFISYSWDSMSHKNWVAKFADDLTKNGIYVLFDDYLESGTTLFSFMELGIARADKVLVIGTPNYKDKCFDISSGVAFEDTIIRGGMFQNLGTKKFIPCLKEGEFMKSFPIILSNCKGYDFTKEERYAEVLDNLCRDIYGKPRRSRLVLGAIPDYAKC